MLMAMREAAGRTRHDLTFVVCHSEPGAAGRPSAHMPWPCMHTVTHAHLISNPYEHYVQSFQGQPLAHCSSLVLSWGVALLRIGSVPPEAPCFERRCLGAAAPAVPDQQLPPRAERLPGAHVYHRAHHV